MILCVRVSDHVDIILKENSDQVPADRKHRQLFHDERTQIVSHPGEMNKAIASSLLWNWWVMLSALHNTLSVPPEPCMCPFE